MALSNKHIKKSNNISLLKNRSREIWILMHLTLNFKYSLEITTDFIKELSHNHRIQNEPRPVWQTMLSGSEEPRRPHQAALPGALALHGEGSLISWTPPVGWRMGTGAFIWVAFLIWSGMSSSGTTSACLSDHRCGSGPAVQGIGAIPGHL